MEEADFFFFFKEIDGIVLGRDVNNEADERFRQCDQLPFSDWSLKIQ